MKRLCRCWCAAGVPGSAMGGHLVLAGRAKDTIVLSSGENIEPATLEDLVAASPFVAHAVIVGQDRRALGALIVPAEEAFEELASVRGGAGGRMPDLWPRAMPRIRAETLIVVLRRYKHGQTGHAHGDYPGLVMC